MTHGLLRTALKLIRTTVLVALCLLTACVLLLIGFAWLLSGGGKGIYVYFIEPNPDRTASFVTALDLGGGATISASSEFLIAGDRIDRTVKVGYRDGGLMPGDGWLDQGTVNVCLPDGDKRGPSVVQVKSASGVATTVRVLHNCPTEAAQ